MAHSHAKITPKVNERADLSMPLSAIALRSVSTSDVKNRVSLYNSETSLPRTADASLRTSDPKARHNATLSFPFQHEEVAPSHGSPSHGGAPATVVKQAPNNGTSHWRSTAQATYPAVPEGSMAGRAKIPDYLKKGADRPRQETAPAGFYQSRYDKDFNCDVTKPVPTTLDLYAGTYLASPYIGNVAVHIPRAQANTLALAERADRRPRHLKETLAAVWRQNLLGYTGPTFREMVPGLASTAASGCQDPSESSLVKAKIPKPEMPKRTGTVDPLC